METLTRTQILDGIQKYFDIAELVDKEVYTKFQQKAWQFFDTELLHTLLVIREAIDKPINVNNWKWKGPFSERGLRTNKGQIFKTKTNQGILYLSAHVMGKAVDFDVEGMTAEEVREWLKENKEILPYKIRLEHIVIKTGKPITWVHLDTMFLDENPKIYFFNV